MGLTKFDGLFAFLFDTTSFITLASASEAMLILVSRFHNSMAFAVRTVCSFLCLCLCAAVSYFSFFK